MIIWHIGNNNECKKNLERLLHRIEIRFIENQRISYQEIARNYQKLQNDLHL